MKKNITRGAILTVGIGLMSGCGYTGPASCQSGGCRVSHPANYTAGMYFPPGTGECDAICEEVENCDGQAMGTVVNEELTSTSCDADSDS